MLRTRRVLLGRLCWWVQPVVILTELIAVAVVAAPYSLLHNTISDLGARGCGTVRYPAVEVPVCSPAHVVVNGGMIVGGLLLVLGAVLLSPTYAFGKAGIAARALWIVSGASSIGTGLVPIDTDLERHALVSIPVILLQPLALGLHALTLARRGPALWWPLVGVAVVLLLDALFFLVRRDVEWGGLLERTAIWPVLLALPLLASAQPVSERGKVDPDPRTHG